MSQQNDDEALVQASQRGDLAAFNILVGRYQTTVYNVAYRLLGERTAAEDATQDAFLLAFRGLHTFRGGSFKTWLLRITTNACYDQLRIRKRRPSTSLDAMNENPDEPGFDPPDSGETPEEHTLRTELASGLREGLSALPDDQRLVVILSDVQGLSYEEIAAVTGTNMGTVKSRLSRARSRLRDILTKQHGLRELLPSKFRLNDRTERE